MRTLPAAARQGFRRVVRGSQASVGYLRVPTAILDPASLLIEFSDRAPGALIFQYG